MKDTLGYEESRQLQNEGYLQEERVELRDNAGVRSIPTTSDSVSEGQRKQRESWSRRDECG